MRALSNKKQLYLYLWLGVLWLLFWILHSLLSYPRTAVLHCMNECWLLVYIVPVNYLFFEYSLPAIERKRPQVLVNVLIGVLLVTAHLLLVSFGLYGWTFIGSFLNSYAPLRQSTLIPDGPYYRMMEGAMYQAQSGLASVFFFGIGKLLYRHVQLRQTAQKLRFQKQEAELNYLRSQTNPHFLFNTLNNIYSLARDKSDLAPEAILRLSQLLRFMLYETGGACILLEQELQIITDFIALEKLRYDDTLQVDFSLDVDDMKQALPPLLLMPLVENAFKHGVSETRSEPFVTICLSVQNSRLVFSVKNSFDPSMQSGGKERIGLPNLRRQLELLYSDYKLSAEHSESMYLTILEINLASHI